MREDSYFYYWICDFGHFYEVRESSLPHGGISKIFFLDHFSASFLGQKFHFEGKKDVWFSQVWQKLTLSPYGRRWQKHKHFRSELQLLSELFNDFADLKAKVPMPFVRNLKQFWFEKADSQDMLNSINSRRVRIGKSDDFF